MKALILALAFIAALIIFATAAAAEAQAPGFVEELKDWVEVLGPIIAIIGAAWFGFRGVRHTQASNARLAREQAESNAALARQAAEEAWAAEQRHRRTEARTLARVLAAELRACINNLTVNAAIVEKATEKDETFNSDVWSGLLVTPMQLYQTQVPKIGLLGELASVTVAVYDKLQRLNKNNEDLSRVSRATGKPIVAKNFRSLDAWRNTAAAADEIVTRLEAYDPPEDI